MQKLKFKTLSETEDIDQFLSKVENYSGVRLPRDYVERSRIVGVFSHEKLAGGYMLITSPEFRSLSFIPDRIKTSHKFFKKDQYEMMEVNGLWIGPALRKPRQQFAVWAHLVKDIFFSRKRIVLLLRSSKNSTMKKFTDMAIPTSIYEGQPNILAGQRTHDVIQVSFTTRWRIILNSHKYYYEYLERKRRAFKFANQKPVDVINNSDQLEYG